MNQFQPSIYHKSKTQYLCSRSLRLRQIPFQTWQFWYSSKNPIPFSPNKENTMYHSKKRLASIKSSKGQRDQWQPTGPCRFRQLPPTSLMNILSRLSPNTLFSCRCVCKSWLFMISDPHFNRLRHSRSPMGILIQTYPHRHNWKSRKLDFTQIVECAGPDLQLEKMSFCPKISIPLIGDRTDPTVKYGLINSCNGLLCLSGPQNNKLLYVCNPILGEFITTPPLDTGVKLSSFVGLGFSAATNEYKVLNTSCSRRAQMYTIGTGVWRDIGKPPYGAVRSPFNAFLHGALHWATQYWTGDEFMHSFNFETEKFETIPPPSHFAPKDKLKEWLTLGVLEGCLLLCVFDDDSSKFEMWIMRDYGVQDSWTKIFVIENLYPRRYQPEEYGPIMFLSNGEILMSYGVGAVVCYNPETKSFRKTSIAPTESEFVAVAYSPSFVSLYNIAKGEEVERIRNNENFNKLFSEGSSSAAGSGTSAHQCTNLNPGSCPPGVEEALPIPIITTSSATSNEQVDFALRIGSKCAICGGQLGYVFRGKGFAMCQKCFDASSS